jgi:hypothetical protein
MACGKNCGDNCGCCFEDGVATTTHQVDGCTVFDVVISSDACNTVSLGSDGGLLVKECAGVFEDSLCDDATDPPTPFVRTTIIACDGTRTIVDTTPDGDPYTVVGNVVCCGDSGSSETVTTLTNTVLGHLIGTYTNELGVPVDINETITALGYNPATNILTYTNETGAPTNVDLTALAIDINVASMAYNPLTGVITLTETDGSIHTIDIGPPVETVTTLIETPANRTATYTNELGVMTVLSETDFTANSQVIPATCEGVLADADVKRELPVRWHAASNTYKAYDDGKIFVVSDQSLPTGNGVFGNVTNANDGDIVSVQTVSITNPSSCRSMLARYYATGSDFHFGLVGVQVGTEFGVRSQISVNGSPFANYAPFGGDDCGYFCTVALPAPGKYNWAMAGHTENFVIPPSGVLTISIRKVLFVATPAPIYFESDGRSVTLVGVTI